jgi:hypothetical protein
LKKFVVNILIFACLWVSPAMAESDITQAHSLAIQWQHSDDLIEELNRQVKYHPVQYTLQYSYQIDAESGITASAWGIQDSKKLQAGFFLDHDGEGYSLAYNYQLSPDWVCDIGLATSKSFLQINSINNSRFYQDRHASDEVYAGVSYNVFWYDISLTPGLSITYQESQVDTDQGLNGNIQLETQRFHGSYGSASINMAYLLESSLQVLWVPSVTISWSETMEGKVTDKTTVKRQNSQLSFSQLEQRDDSGSGSGGASISLLLLAGDYYSDITLSQTIGAGNTLYSYGLQIGVEF